MKLTPPIHLKVNGPKDAMDGIYLVPHLKTKDYRFHVVVSTGMGWEHVSVTIVERVTQKGKRTIKGVPRCPTWLEMCFVKDIFWDPNECVVQFHPPMSEYVNNHHYCLHLWKPMEKEMPVPDAVLVGLKGIEQWLDLLREKVPGHTDGEYLSALYYYANAADPGSEKWLEDLRYMIEPESL